MVVFWLPSLVWCLDHIVRFLLLHARRRNVVCPLLPRWSDLVLLISNGPGNSKVGGGVYLLKMKSSCVLLLICKRPTGPELLADPLSNLAGQAVACNCSFSFIIKFLVVGKLLLGRPD